MVPKVFISYAKEKFLEARKICDLLDYSGCKTWFDKRDLLPGEDWKKKIEEEIKHSDVFLACISKEFNIGPRFLQKELKLASQVIELLPEGNVFVIPIRLEPQCEVPSRLQDFQWCDYYDINGPRKLINSIATHFDASLVIQPFHDSWPESPSQFDDFSNALVSELTRLNTEVFILLQSHKNSLSYKTINRDQAIKLANDCANLLHEKKRFDIEITIINHLRCYVVHSIYSDYWPSIIGASFDVQWSISQGSNFSNWFWERANTMDSGFLSWIDRFSSNAKIEHLTFSGAFEKYKRKTIVSFRRFPISEDKYWTIVIEGHEGAIL